MPKSNTNQWTDVRTLKDVPSEKLVEHMLKKGLAIVPCALCEQIKAVVPIEKKDLMWVCPGCARFQHELMHLERLN